jgi:hypothetical protein
MIHGQQFFLQKVSIVCLVFTRKSGIISLKAGIWNLSGVKRVRGRKMSPMFEGGECQFQIIKIWKHLKMDERFHM